MFHSTRLKLTAWYLLIIMVVSLFFSLTIYNRIDSELGRLESAREAREQRIQATFGQFGLTPPELPQIGPEVVEAARTRLILSLVIINLGILVISGAAGYFLAGMTLKPIREMVDEQNRFVTDASHELRTPLTALKSEIEVSLMDKKLTITDAKSLLSSNLEEVNKLQALTDSLIKLTQYRKKNDKLNFQSVSIKKILEEALKKVTAISKTKQIKIKSTIRDFKVMGEAQSLTELFVILLDNAIKYSPNKSTVLVSVKPDDGHVLVSVKDSGAGIEKTDIPYIFNRFFRSTKTKDGKTANGYGLGLSIAQQIAKKHNAAIGVESSIGTGSTFTVKIPKR